MLTGITIVIVTVLVPVPPILVELTVAVNVPEAVGVPLIKPVAVFKESPAGRPIAANFVGLLEAVIE